MEETAVHPVTLTDANYNDEVKKFPGVVLVDYWAEWCPPCHIMAPHIDTLAAKYAKNEKVKIGKMDADANGNTTMEERVMSLPTFKLFVNGEVVDEVVGAVAIDQLDQMISKNLGAAA